ncbi:Mov34/MPN/PAD-1 family protein [Microbacterium sp. NPDC076911]|uniref:Mov34/MPN/PAD-1 family protein n=1 Tax=Microbacterium sp. NPDC076911 TaxID=3154958 RepID=UPI0034498A09
MRRTKRRPSPRDSRSIFSSAQHPWPRGPSMRTSEQVSTFQSSRAAFDLACRHARESLPRETGGILTGWRADGMIFLDAFLVVHDHRATGRGYWRRESPANKTLADYLRNADHPWIGYVGEWHSHPSPVPASATDVASIRAVAKQVLQPIALVVLMVDAHGNTITADAHVAVRQSRFKSTIYPVALDVT